MVISYITGDVCYPCTDRWIIAHVCNNLGVFNAGVAKALRQRYPQAYVTYHDYVHSDSAKLGANNYVHFEDGNIIVNMIAQDGLPSYNNRKPCNMNALEDCLINLSLYALNCGYDIHMPKIGTGFGGRDWDTEILPLMEKCLDRNNVYVYLLE